MSLPGNDDLNGLVGAMAQLQQQLERAQSDANARSVTGVAASGRVRVEVSGEFSFDRVVIDPSLVDPDDVALLEDLLLAALRDAAGQLRQLRHDAMGGAVSDALGGLFGPGEAGPAVEKG
jgi:hypothetical protein